MPYPSKPAKLRKRSLTVSVDTLTVDRINALVPETGERSARMRAWLEVGLVHTVGPDWRVIADRRIAERVRDGQAA